VSISKDPRDRNGGSARRDGCAGGNSFRSPAPARSWGFWAGSRRPGGEGRKKTAGDTAGAASEFRGGADPLRLADEDRIPNEYSPSVFSFHNPFLLTLCSTTVVYIMSPNKVLYKNNF
jgi:hypothetical protein